MYNYLITIKISDDLEESLKSIKGTRPPKSGYNLKLLYFTSDSDITDNLKDIISSIKIESFKFEMRAYDTFQGGRIVLRLKPHASFDKLHKEVMSKISKLNVSYDLSQVNDNYIPHITITKKQSIIEDYSMFYYQFEAKELYLKMRKIGEDWEEM